MRAPTPQDARAVVRRVLGIGVRSVERCESGACHYVYDVATDDERRVVVRMAAPHTQDVLAGGIYWHARLRAVGIPLPTLLYAEAEGRV